MVLRGGKGGGREERTEMLIILEPLANLYQKMRKNLISKNTHNLAGRRMGYKLYYAASL